MAELLNIDVNGQEVERFLEAMADKETIRRITNRAILEGAMVLKRYAQEGFRMKLGEASSHPSKWLGGKPFYEGVWIKNYPEENVVRVSILKDYRMKWFETGTDDRYVGNRSHSDKARGRKNKNTGRANFRGRIQKDKYGGWFAEARKTSSGEVNDTVIRSINNALEKLKNGEKL